MDSVTQSVSQYIREKGISISTISQKTGITGGVLYPSLREKPTRRLRADEFMSICLFLDVDPWRFTSAITIT